MHNRSISSWDDFPVHQTSEYIRHAATSDRNFYDRYYFNLHFSNDETFAIFGIGQYPNLGVTDAFLAVTHKGTQNIVRASQPLVDRADIGAGPIKVEILEPLESLRVTVDDSGTDDDGNTIALSMDVKWQGLHPAFEEPRQYLRARGTVMFDTQRFAQMGTWEGTLTVAGETLEVTPDRCGGSRDRSWGVRPVGERQPDGIRQDISVMAGMWNYFPMAFDDHAIIYMVHEEVGGARPLEEAVRVWSDPDREPEWLGRPEWDHKMISGTRLVERSTITMPDAPGGPIVIEARPLMTNFVSVGTGYGMDDDWRHGMWQGEQPVVQQRTTPNEELRGIGQYGVVDNVGEFTYNGLTGYGLYEHGFFGPFPPVGLHDRGDVVA